jgi:hypothetical protein
MSKGAICATGFGFIVFVAGYYIACSARKSNQPMYLGRPLTKWLHSGTADGTDHITMNQMLTLKEVTTGEEPEIATFEVPLSYDLLMKIGILRLLVDAKQGEYQPGKGEFVECQRATNGDCLLEWNTMVDSPGQHYLQAQLIVTKRLHYKDSFKITGPTMPFYSSNICQFDPFDSSFDSRGAILHAKLVETNATYGIEMRTPSGQLIGTIIGSTSNGVINEFWDLKDREGSRYSNMNEFSVVFHVTNTLSGRSSSQKVR